MTGALTLWLGYQICKMSSRKWPIICNVTSGKLNLNQPTVIAPCGNILWLYTARVLGRPQHFRCGCRRFIYLAIIVTGTDTWSVASHLIVSLSPLKPTVNDALLDPRQTFRTFPCSLVRWRRIRRYGLWSVDVEKTRLMGVRQLAKRTTTASSNCSTGVSET